MLKITEAQKQKATELGRKHNVDVVRVNDKGEFFTVENYAMLSVNGDKEKLAVVSVVAEIGAVKTEKPKATTETETAETLIEAISIATEPEAVQAILDAEKAGKKRVSVLTAGNKKLESFKTAE